MTVLATFLFGRRVVGARAAFLAALGMTLSFGFVICGRFLLLDGVLSLLVALSLFMAHEAIQGERFRWPWWLASSVCCALGILTKAGRMGALLRASVLRDLRVRPRHLSCMDSNPLSAC